jgi:hypothetical protein
MGALTLTLSQRERELLNMGVGYFTDPNEFDT